tara:strand:+ start:549 stop:1196 length:648 start_codon:yes stop_codon:yes gene_type:complete
MNNLKIKIGISLRITNAINYEEKRDSLSHDWVEFLESINIIPILIPNSISNVDDYLKNLHLDGLILSGGDNIGDDKKRDDTETKIIKFGIMNKLPIFGVCRGMQIINNFFNGTIEKTSSMNHVNNSHSIQIHNENFIRFLDNSITVNSFHQNLINKNNIGTDLEIFATSEIDKTIEGFYHRNYPIIGVMWHPERLKNQESQKIISKIFHEKNFWC